LRNLFLSASALLCFAACAQNPAWPYRSVFDTPASGLEAPTLDWQRANADVAQFPRGHADVLKWEQAHAPVAPAAAKLATLSAKDAVGMARLHHSTQDAEDVRKAWLHAVAAQQSALYLRDVKEATETGAMLARRMAQVGNWSRLEQAREQILLADAMAQLARAHNTAFSAREKLIRAMRPDGAQTDFALPERLPDLPRATTDLRPLPAQARSEAREAYFAYRTAYDLAVHYRDDIVPLRKRILDELLLRYSGMLASVWELLAETRLHAESVNSAIEAQRDFWLAEADFQATLQGY
jgi:outer membrane protein TolC